MREQKAATVDKSTENVVESLVNAGLVTVVGVAYTDKKAVKSPETVTKDKQKNHSTPVKKFLTDAKLEAMDQKWSECFSHF